MSEIVVSELFYYPIKSCAGTAAKEMEIAPLGPLYDREWMIIDAAGKFVTQRKNPELALIHPTVESDELFIEAPGMSTLHVEPADQVDRQVDFFHKAGAGETQGTKANAWLSEFLKQEVELIRITEPRPIKPELVQPRTSTHIAFADGFPLLLTAEASLTSLNQELISPICWDRFRPNIVVSGEKAGAYQEDYWRKLQIGTLSANIMRACARCLIPNNNQATGLRKDNNPVTAALRKTRRGHDTVGNKPGLFFGQNMNYVFVPGTVIKVGDTVMIEEASDERNFVLDAA